MYVKVAKRISVLLVVCLMISACTDDQITKLAKASDDLAASISAAITLKQQLAKDGHISPAQELELTKGLFAVNEAAIAFNSQLKATKTMDGNAKAALVKNFSAVTDALTQINGVYGTDTATQQKVKTAIGAISAAVGIVQGFLN